MSNNLSSTKWNIKLRKNVKFHNGEKFNADAVKWTYERIYISSITSFIMENTESIILSNTL